MLAAFPSLLAAALGGGVSALAVSPPVLLQPSDRPAGVIGGVDVDVDTALYGPYVFVRSGSDWVEQTKLVDPDVDPEDRYGQSVALAGDTAVVAAPLDDDAGADAGALYVFVRTGTTWTRQAKLVATDAEAQERLASDGSLAIDGDTIVAGTVERGLVYVFHRSGGGWTQEGRLRPAAGAPANRYGGSVAVHGDLIVAGGRPTIVFERDQDGWHERDGLLPPSPDPGMGFGASVGVWNDTIVVGDPARARGGVPGVGTCWVFVRVAAGWRPLVDLFPFDGRTSDELRCTDVEGDGVVAGTIFHTTTNGRGASYVYERSAAGELVLTATVSGADVPFAITQLLPGRRSGHVLSAILAGPTSPSLPGGAVAAVFELGEQRTEGASCATGLECASTCCAQGICGPGENCAPATPSVDAGVDAGEGVEPAGGDSGCGCRVGARATRPPLASLGLAVWLAISLALRGRSRSRARAWQATRADRRLIPS